MGLDREAEHPELAELAVMLRQAKLGRSWGDEEYVRYLVATLADSIERTAYGSTDSLGNLGRRLLAAEDDFQYRVKRNLIKVRVIRHDEEQWRIAQFKEAVLLHNTDVIELRHASIAHEVSHDKEFLYVESWVADAIQLYRKNEGFAGMKLRTFLKKMDYANSQVEEVKAKAELAAEAKVDTYVNPAFKDKKKKRPKIVSKSKSGKNEYKPRNRDRRYP